MFFALSHEALRHIVMLLGHSGGELPSGYLAKRFPSSWPTTTRHLKVLEDAGLVQVTRKGHGSHCRLDRERVQRVGRKREPHDRLARPATGKDQTQKGG